MLYGTTTDFLRAFGIPNLESLPRTSEEIDEMFDKANKKLNEEALAQEQIELPEEVASRIEGKDGEEATSPANAEETSEPIPASDYSEELSAEDDVTNEDI